MAILELPITSAPAQAFTTQLGDQKFYFELQFNSRSGVWTIDMLDDATREPIVIGLPILLGIDLLDAYNFPYGALVAVERGADGKEASASDLGARVSLFWVSPDEVIE
jgi:hypothetical protein